MGAPKGRAATQGPQRPYISASPFSPASLAAAGGRQVAKRYVLGPALAQRAQRPDFPNGTSGPSCFTSEGWAFCVKWQASGPRRKCHAVWSAGKANRAQERISQRRQNSSQSPLCGLCRYPTVFEPHCTSDLSASPSKFSQSDCGLRRGHRLCSP
jgi:hypothetical protein